MAIVLLLSFRVVAVLAVVWSVHEAGRFGAFTSPSSTPTTVSSLLPTTPSLCPMVDLFAIGTFSSL